MAHTSGTPVEDWNAQMTAPPVSPALSVGIVGAGRVGAVLGARLLDAGHRVSATSAVSPASLARAADLLPGVPVVDVVRVPEGADLVLLTVPDDTLPHVVAALLAAGSLRPGQLLAHTSGRHGLAVLDPAAQRGVLPLALHPVFPFSGTRLDVVRLPGIAFGVTAPASLHPRAEALVAALGGEPVRVDEQHRPLWHAALAHGANHLTALVVSCADLLRAAGVERPERVLGPLLDSALDGALTSGDAALTGPVVRGDAGTVRAHLAALPDEARPVYVALARTTVDRAIASGRLDPLQAGALLDVLGRASRDGVAT